MNALSYLKMLFLSLFRRASKEVLEEVDDILSDFDDYIDRLIATANRKDQDARRISAEIVAADTAYKIAMEERARATSVATKLSDLVGKA